MKNIRVIDMFCGAGGSSWGAHSAGARIIAGFDLWPIAGKVYRDNFPKSHFFPGHLEKLNPQKITESLGKIDLIIASPECTNHSVAKGNRPRCEKSRDTALQVIKFARAFKPRWLVNKNVTS